jgi:FkbM family methyltransferase
MRPVMPFHVPDRLKFYWQLLKYYSRELRWEALAQQPRSFVVGVQPGLSMRLYTDSELCRLIYCRHFEATERMFLNAFLQPGDVFVDVGANIGLFTLIAAICVGPTGRVFAFEPTTATFERLVDNVRLNDLKHVTSVKIALSDVNGQLELVRSMDGFDAWNSLARPTMGRVFCKESVDTAAWDQFAGQHDLAGAVTMMKIDVEGWESRVLAGGKEVFARRDAPVLQIEFADESARAAGSSCGDLYKMLERLGYRLFVYDSEMHALVPESMREEYPSVNLIAAKDPDVVNARVRTRTTQPDQYWTGSKH